MSLFGAIKTGFGFVVGVVIAVLIICVIIAAIQDENEKEAQDKAALIQRCYASDDKTGCSKDDIDKAAQYWNEHVADVFNSAAQNQKMNFN